MGNLQEVQEVYTLLNNLLIPSMEWGWNGLCQHKSVFCGLFLGLKN